MRCSNVRQRIASTGLGNGRIPAASVAVLLGKEKLLDFMSRERLAPTGSLASRCSPLVVRACCESEEAGDLSRHFTGRVGTAIARDQKLCHQTFVAGHELISLAFPECALILRSRMPWQGDGEETNSGDAAERYRSGNIRGHVTRGLLPSVVESSVDRAVLRGGILMRSGWHAS